MYLVLSAFSSSVVSLLATTKTTAFSYTVCTLPPNILTSSALNRKSYVDLTRNVMAHAQKPELGFLRNGRVHLNRRGGSVQSTAGSRGVRISGSNAGYTMFRGSVKGTGYPLHSRVPPSLPLPCVTVCHHISTGLYKDHTLLKTDFQHPML